ncbi:MAG TPA: hypothetical protein VG796_17765 [Verrucomicrobiales bacterium]|nr:hypothetical protein [Verrucomicrobiales bacterium]
MKPKLLRFSGSLCLVLFAGGLPLWFLWRSADLARQQGLALEFRLTETKRKIVREKKTTVAQRLSRLASAPLKLSAADFLEWESFCSAQPWTDLLPVLEKRRSQVKADDEVRTLLLIRWAMEDGAAAAAWAMTHIPDSNHPSTAESDFGSLGATWAWHDPQGFSAAQKEIDPDKAARWQWTEPWYPCRWLARRDPVLAFEMGRKPFNSTSDWTRPAAEAITPFLKTPAEAKTLLEQVRKEKHGPHDSPVNYTTVILQAWADMDEAGALAAAAAYPGEDTGSVKANLTNYVMRGRPQTEATADEWLKQIQENRRGNEMDEIAKGLMSADMAAAGRWLLKQNPALRGEGLRNYMDTLAFLDPAAALTFAQSVPDTGTGETSVARVVSQWATSSPGATTGMLKSQGWSDARISQLKDRMAVQYPAAVQWWWDW